MKEKIKAKLQSNQGFTMQDLIIAIMIITIFAGLIGSIYVTIVTIQSETKLDTAVTFYAIQILEYLDEIAYDNVVNGMESTLRSRFSIPNRMLLDLDVAPHENSQDSLKKITLTISYTFRGENHQLVMENVKVKEK